MEVNPNVLLMRMALLDEDVTKAYEVNEGEDDPTIVVEIKSTQDYVRNLEKFERRQVAQWLYRGHNDSSFQLQPGLYRCNIEGSYAEWGDFETYIMDSFKREALPHLTRIPDDNFEWLTLAQHYGVPTRLLDWTTNPLIALYFAVESTQRIDKDKDANVWCLGFPSVNNCHSQSTIFAKVIGAAFAGFVHLPNHLSPRIINQSGCFTIHDKPEPLNEQVKLVKECVFVRFDIKSKNKSRILKELYDLGIHRALIYPGLEGIAAKIKYEVNDVVEWNSAFPSPEDGIETEGQV